MNTVRAVVPEGKVELLEPLELPEGTEALVTLLTENSIVSTETDAVFWSHASVPAASAIWDNAEDDIYAELLQN